MRAAGAVEGTGGGEHSVEREATQFVPIVAATISWARSAIADRRSPRRTHTSAPTRAPRRIENSRAGPLLPSRSSIPPRRRHFALEFNLPLLDYSRELISPGSRRSTRDRFIFARRRGRGKRPDGRKSAKGIERDSSRANTDARGKHYEFISR